MLILTAYSNQHISLAVLHVGVNKHIYTSIVCNFLNTHNLRHLAICWDFSLFYLHSLRDMKTNYIKEK